MADLSQCLLADTSGSFQGCPQANAGWQVLLRIAPEFSEIEKEAKYPRTAPADDAIAPLPQRSAETSTLSEFQRQLHHGRGLPDTFPPAPAGIRGRSAAGTVPETWEASWRTPGIPHREPARREMLPTGPSAASTAGPGIRPPAPHPKRGSTGPDGVCS